MCLLCRQRARSLWLQHRDRCGRRRHDREFRPPRGRVGVPDRLEYRKRQEEVPRQPNRHHQPHRREAPHRGTHRGRHGDRVRRSAGSTDRHGQPFHRGHRSELHGITIVVDTDGPEVYVGRCDDVLESEVILVDADVHREDEDGLSKAAYLTRAAQYGVWKKLARISIPRDRVLSIRRLAEV